MDSEEILVEFLVNSDRAKGGAIRPVSTTKIKENIHKLTSLVQQLVTEKDPNYANGLVLNEVEIAIKLTDTGEVILLGDGQNHGAITLRFRRPDNAIATSETTTAPSLTSSSGVNYAKLQALLASGDWSQANQETWNVMCQAARKKVGSVLTTDEIKQIACDDIQLIDNLWRQHSQGRYGFSAQNQIYMSSILG
jgi:hypothetical protein